MSYSPSYTDLFRPCHLLHVRNGALAHECDGYGVGANAVASAAGRRVASAAQRKRREGGWTIAAKTWIGAETLDRMSRNAHLTKPGRTTC